MVVPTTTDILGRKCHLLWVRTHGSRGPHDAAGVEVSWSGGSEVEGGIIIQLNILTYFNLLALVTAYVLFLK